MTADNKPKTIAITGGTRGIGFGLAKEFAALGCRVSLCGRSPKAVTEAIDKLQSSAGKEMLFGFPCDVRKHAEVSSFWDAVKQQWGAVDIWINNAGISHLQSQLWSIDPETLSDVVETNIIGALNGASVALRGMIAQGYGALYNMEGLGSDGRIVPGVSLYGSTKCALAYITDALVKESRSLPVIVGAIRPGMVVTDLLLRDQNADPDTWKKNRAIFNILADRVETVAPWIARKVLANTRTGVRIQWLTPGKAAWRFMTAAFVKRNVVVLP